MDSIEVLLVAAVGLIAGVGGGLAGLGGSLFMLPGLALFLGYGSELRSEHHLYMAAALTTNVLISAPAAHRHYLNGLVRVRWLRILLPTTLSTIAVGVWLSNRYSGELLLRMLGVVIAAAIVFNLAVHHWPRKARLVIREEPAPRRSLVSGLGLLTGLLAGLLGIGGGAILVTALQTLGRMDVKPAIGTSSAAICLTAVVGATFKLATLHQHGFAVADALSLAVVMGAWAMLGSVLGATLTQKLPVVAVRWIAATLLLLIAARMILS